MHATPEGSLSKLLTSLNLRMVQSFVALFSPPHISHPAWYEAAEFILASSAGSSKSLDSSLKRHTAFLKKTRQSVGAENRDQLLKDIETLSLEKYVDELGSAVLEGIQRCKSERDVWSAVEVRLYPCCLWSASRGGWGYWFVDNQRDSPSVSDVIHTKDSGFVICGAWCTVSCFSCWPTSRAAGEGGQCESHQATPNSACVLGVGHCWNYQGCSG